MVRNVDTHEPDPHFDGKYEGPINDTLASASEKMGIRTDIDPTRLKNEKNSFDFKPKKDQKMAKFERMFRSNPKDK